MHFQVNTAGIDHTHPDHCFVMFGMGCAASLLSERLRRTSTKALPVQFSLVYLGHYKILLDTNGLAAFVTEMSAQCGHSGQVTIFHIVPTDSDTRDALSLDGRLPTQVQSVLELIVRDYLNQQVTA